MVELREKTPAERRRWLEEMWEDYLKDLVGAGLSHEEASKNAQRNRDQLFVDGEPIEGQYIFDVLDDDEVVGGLWLGTRPDSDEWYIYDIVIDPRLRGRGLGRSTMEAAEAYASRHGGRRLGLNVFGPNAVARHLYESMDYRVMAISMFKDIP